MKIGIVTQPLLNNYGGYLQAWALQEQLRKMGHEPITIDYLPPQKSWYKFIFSWCKTIVLKCIDNRKKRQFIKPFKRSEKFHIFLQKNMVLTPIVHCYTSDLVTKFGFDALIVGSDQVWRPCYNKFLEDMFLRFAYNDNIIKIAYAASFGVDNWEYSDTEEKSCRLYAKSFDAISVREESGITLCKKHLGIDAIEVIDPTLLHSKEDYEKLCANIPRIVEPFLAGYILDFSSEKQAFIEKISRQYGLKFRIFSANADAKLSIEDWLAIYRDASYIITDSFHGTIFSIIFHKPFLSITNESRGSSRFNSLLKKLKLGDRLMKISEQKVLSSNIDWCIVDKCIESYRKTATTFLNNHIILS